MRTKRGPRTQAKNDLLWISYWFEWPSATWPCAEGCNSSDHVALISADGINWMKPLPLCLHCRRLRGTAVFVCYSTQGAEIPFACMSVKLNVNIWMRDVLWLLTRVSWAHWSVTSDFNTYYLSASGCFLFLCWIYVWFGPCGQLLDFCLHSSLFSSATELSAGSLSL